MLTFLNCSTTMVRELKNIEHDQQRKQILAQKYQSEWQELRYAAITESTLLLGLAFVQEVLVQLTTPSRDSESPKELSAL